jgi:hypothetical protein
VTCLLPSRRRYLAGMARNPRGLGAIGSTAGAALLFAGCIGQIGTGGGLSGNGGGSSSGTIGVGTPAGTGGGSGTTTGTGGSGGSATASDTGLPCDVQTVLSTRCWACHGATTALPGQPVLVTRDNLMAPAAVNPSLTYAQEAVSRMQSSTAPMPPAPASRATSAEIATLNEWINAGYPAGSCGGADAGTSPPDPFSLAPTCTSNTTWLLGNEGRAEMNPGMACISCHQTSRDNPPKFTIAGTVYPTGHEPDLCNGANGADGAQVVIVGADGKTQSLTPNSAGNFSSQTAVALPYQAKVVYMGRERVMTAAQTSGDCNGCHTQSGTMSAPGRIVLP